MSLINCPECNKEISDRAMSCPNCGYPLIEKNHCIINGVDVDCSFVLDKNILIDPDLLELCELEMMDKANLSPDVAEEVVKKWSKAGKIPPFFNGKNIKEWEQETFHEPQQQEIPKCPTCGSTNIEKISLGKKAVGGALFGLFSSDVRKTMYCQKCGYKW